jgi:phage gp29-like protein
MNTQTHVGRERVAETTRNRFNPIRNLVPERLAATLEDFRRGHLRGAALLWDAIERRDPMLASVVNKRKKAAGRCQWDILTVDDSPDSRTQRDALRGFYDRIEATDATDENHRGGVSLLVRQMMDAIGKRYAVHEIVWRPSEQGRLGAQFRFVPLWFFEATTGRLRFLQREFAVDGVELEPDGWLVTTGDGLMEASSVAYLYKHLPLKDWLGYSEKFGFPGILGRTDAVAGSEQWRAMEEAVRAFAVDFAAVCNRSE